MRLQKIVINRRCNQACVYCTVCRDDNEELAHSAEQRIRAAADEAEFLVLTGGEPTLVDHLPELVQAAKASRSGSRSVALETNATLIDDSFATELRRVGLDVARVKLPGFHSAVDLGTRDPGGFRRTVAGLRALARAGVAVELVAPIVRSSISLLPSLPEELVSTFGTEHGVRAIVANVPLDARDHQELVAYPEAVDCLLELEARARLAQIPVRLDDGEPIPPCVFPSYRRASRRDQLDSGGGDRQGFVRLPLCDACDARERCPGLAEQYVRTRRAHDVIPLRSTPSLPAVPTVEQTSERAARSLVTREVRTDGESRHVIRLSFHCDQACHFCFVPTFLPPPSDEAIRDAIDEAAAAGATVVFSGGEPTLHPGLATYIGLARAGRGPQLETNALGIASLEDAQQLKLAGLRRAVVSLHGSSREISDGITRAPGTFARTVRGLDHLCEASIEVVVRTVVCTQNVADLSTLVELVSNRWPSARIELRLAVASEHSSLDGTRVRYAELAPRIVSASSSARRLGVGLDLEDVLDELPLCLVPEPMTRTAASKRTDSSSGPRVKVAACARCTVESRCAGLSRSYAEMHGISELKPAPAS